MPKKIKITQKQLEEALAKEIASKTKQTPESKAKASLKK